MVYLDRYMGYLQQLHHDIEKVTRTEMKVALGYTSNLDVLLKWDSDVFNSILKRHLHEEPSLKKGKSIASAADFARVVSYYLTKGLGGEVDITDEEVCEYLEKKFEIELALGGTAAHGAAALGAIGFPVITHLTDSSRRVSEMMKYPEISVVSGKELIPVVEGMSNDGSVKHFVLQYHKKSVIVINGKEYVIPAANRLILDYDVTHKDLRIKGEYLRYLEDNASTLHSYLISGFNLIVDPDVLNSVLGKLVGHYGRVKRENPQCILYLESAHFLSLDIKHLVFTKLASYIDIIGMNEEELTDIAGYLGSGLIRDSLGSILHNLEVVIRKYPVKGIVLHTKDYALYYGQFLADQDLDKGLTLGNLMAGTRARTGYYGSLKDYQESLALDLSPVGLAFAEKLEAIKTKRYVRLVPTRYMRQPRSTVGLGDTFAAGMQMGFINY